MKLIFSITTLLIAIFVTPLGVSSEPAAPWRIGGIASLTGPGAGWGEMARLGWELGIDEANKSGGLGGRPIELLVEDGATNPSKAVSGFKKLTEIDRVDAVLGEVWDYLTTPLIPLSTASKKLLVSTIIDRSARGSSPFFFTIGPRTDSLRGALDQFFKINPEIKSVAFLSWDNDWGYAYEGEWTAAAKRAGVEVVSIQRKIDFSSDWKTEISRLIPKKPDAVFFGYQANSILKQLRQVGLSPKILTTSNVLEELTSGQVAPTLSEGIFYTDWIPDTAFVKRFTAKFGKAPMFNAPEAYEAVRATLAALKANPQEPWVGMKQAKYAGVSGPIDFSSSSNGNLATARLFKVSGGIGRQVE